MGIASTVLGWLTGLPLGSISKDLSSAYQAYLKTQSDTEKQASLERIDALAERSKVLVAEAWSRINMVVRTTLALPVVVVLWKIILYDKALGQWTGGHTDSLSPELWWVVDAVIGFYFLSIGLDQWLKHR